MEIRWLAELLANEQAVGPLLKFLTSTEILMFYDAHYLDTQFMILRWSI